MLLGYIVSQRGIEPNPKKVTALERMGPIRDLKGVQKVLGCLAALSSRPARRGYPFTCNTPCFCSVVISANNHLNTSLTTLEES
jgi:hypothetical protein